MAHPPTLQTALAHDALQMMLTWPEHAPSWWHLTSCIQQLPEAHRLPFLASLEQVRFASAHARWFQQSALHHATGDIAHLVRQAELAPSLPGAERWMTLANVLWWAALSETIDRAAFRRVFVDSRLATLLDTLGRGIADAARAPSDRGGVQRVAIVAQHLSTGQHAPTALTFNVRAVLEGAGLGTRVFGAQDQDLPAMRGHTAAAYVSNVAPVDAATWQLRIPGQVAVTGADVRFSLAWRWNALSRLVDDYDPDVVLFVGFFSPLVSALGRRHPVVGLSLHAMPPLTAVDVWLAAEPQPEPGQHWPGLPPPQAVHFPYRFWPVATVAMARSEVDVPADAVLLLTCATRLGPSSLAQWIADVVRFLDAQPRAHWLLIGLQPAERELLAGRHARIRVLPLQPDVAGWIAASDLYLNPPRVGGGATVAIAMQLGVPVVSMAHGDGGDKIEPMAVHSAQAYGERLAGWAADSAARAREGQRLQAKFRSELDMSNPVAAAQLADACRAAQARFRVRQASAQPESIHEQP